MLSHARAGSILAVLTLAILGCDPAEPAPEGPPKPEETTSKVGKAAPPPAVDPSRVPTLPEPDPSGKNPGAKPADKPDTPEIRTQLPDK